MSDSRRELRSVELRDSVRAQVAVEAIDTVREVTMITVRENEAGDTVKVVQVTERDRIRSCERVSEQVEKVVVRVDTVVVERRDSVFVEVPVSEASGGGGSAVVDVLRWVFWIVVAGVVLVCVLKFF